MVTKIKICGITRKVDALAAAAAGADAIGLMFYAHSPRYIEPEQARAIAAALPPFVSKVGVFVNASREEVHRICDRVELDFLQLQGDEDESLCVAYGRPYIKGLRMHDIDDLMARAGDFASARALLVDAHVDGKFGGTGTRLPWKPLPRIEQPVILAGGLDSANVGRAVRTMTPYAVDVSTGVERARGVKDADKIHAFVRSVRAADRHGIEDVIQMGRTGGAGAGC